MLGFVPALGIVNAVMLAIAGFGVVVAFRVPQRAASGVTPPAVAPGVALERP